MRGDSSSRRLDGGQPTLATLAEDLAVGRTNSRTLVEDCLARIERASPEARCAMVHVTARAARAAANGYDWLRAAGAAPSPYAGIPVSVKDLFDVAGEVTTAGSRVLADRPPATSDAFAVAQLRRAGFVIIGRTNMTEFAYSGLGLNPHYGTPVNPWDRENRRIPGGSSSGAAVSVAAGMAHAALATDTGGSCRIPAAFTRLTGFKPTARRVSLSGTVPLSSSLDSIGPIARSVACCAVVDAMLAGDVRGRFEAADIVGLRLCVPESVALDALDDIVAATFDRALSRLSVAGARINGVPFPEFDEVAAMNARGGFTAAESYAWHRALIEHNGHLYDPRVLSRIRRGADQSAADYIELIAARKSLIERASNRLSSYDALVMPTVAIVPPLISDIVSDEAYMKANALALRNATLINMIDGCAISMPASRLSEAPVGLTVGGIHGADRRTLGIAAAIEGVLTVNE